MAIGSFASDSQISSGPCILRGFITTVNVGGTVSFRNGTASGDLVIEIPDSVLTAGEYFPVNLLFDKGLYYDEQPTSVVVTIIWDY